MKTKLSKTTLFAFGLVLCFLPSFTHAEDTPTTTDAVASTTEDVVQLFVRYEDAFVFDGLIPLTPSTSSALAALQAADATSTAFALSDVVYYENFDSYLVNCIEIMASSTVNACYNWNYIVNGQHPQVGMDDYALAANNVVYVYFSVPWRLSMPTTTAFAGATTTFETWRYQYDNLLESWVHDPTTQVTVSAPNPAPTGWWDATLPVTTTLSNDAGTAEVTMTATGTFSASITAADFSKWSAPVAFSVIAMETATTTNATTTAEQPAPAPVTNSGGGGSSQEPSFNVPAALSFLSAQQQADGSFGSALYSDWAAVAYGAADGTNETEERLKAYLEDNPTPGTLLTDLERRAMALMALGINPRNGTATDYIQAILGSYANGQFGETELFNDDIFAFFPLLDAGITPTDPRIASSTEFILSFQDANGSWGSVDMTAAAVQVLSLVPNTANVPAALERAGAYLRQIQTAGWSDPFSASWGMQALAALGTPAQDAYLQRIQANDGGVSTTLATVNNRVWATSYAVPAALGKQWSNILASFTAPASSSQPASVPIGAGGFIIPPQPEELTTSTTSTPLVVHSAPTSTPEPALEAITQKPLQEQEPQPSPASPPTPHRTVIVATPLSIHTATSEATTLIAPEEITTSTRETARNVFKGSAAITTLLGLYLIWRFFRALV